MIIQATKTLSKLKTLQQNFTFGKKLSQFMWMNNLPTSLQKSAIQHNCNMEKFLYNIIADNN